MHTERREHLKQYILACVRDNVLSLSDFTSPAIVEKVLGTLSRDIKAVLKDVARTGGGNLLRVAGAALAGLAEDVVVGRRKSQSRQR